MDGNGRWAKQRGLHRTQGHKEGLNAAKAVVKKAADIGIEYITLYTFSTENWKRTSDEVGFLMSLIKVHLRAELVFYAENGIRVLCMGNIDGLPEDIATEIRYTMKATESFEHTTVILALNYGGQDEIIRAIKKIPQESVQTLTIESFSGYLDLPALPQVDLLIRTGGEKRISNFLLWQSAYAELFFNDILWPDWNGDCLIEAIADYQTRDRRFGGIQK
ncbi:polyprenyl diphosphate synthase [Brucepastera parasyntrophica]|uniref:polyprenyl diphosphate synthase n=1 Tax=Brucepastera parasyntrophica TaxID=2880008 RepID=UPI003F70A021